MWRRETNEERREKEGTLLIGSRLDLLLAAAVSWPRQGPGDCWLYQRPDGISSGGATTLIGHYHTRLRPASGRSALNHRVRCAFPGAFWQLLLMMRASFRNRWKGGPAGRRRRNI